MEKLYIALSKSDRLLASAYGQIILEAETIAPHKRDTVLIKAWGWFGKINTAVSTIGHAHNAGKFISEVIDRLPE